MKITKIIYMAAAVLMMACTAEQEAEKAVEGNVPITLGYTLQEAQTTRTVSPNVNNKYITPGGQVYVNITSGTDVIYDGKYLVTKALPDGETTKTASEMAPMGGTNNISGVAGTAAIPYYPLDGSTVDIKAFYPASASTGSFTVMSDQSTDEGYAASDLMWATPITGQGLSLTPVNLTFNHKLTKIVINVNAVEGIGNITAIRLTGVKPTVSFNNTTDGAVGEASGDATTITVAMGGNLTTGTAIIPAQAIDGAFVQIVTAGGTANFTVNKTFAANNCYTADITVGASSIDLTNTISDWHQESFSLGGGYVAQSLGELTNIINSGAAYREYLGKYVDATGTIHSEYTTGDIGRIAYMNTSDVDEDIPGSRILVLALEDAVGAIQKYKNNASAGESEWNDISKSDGYSFTISHNSNATDYPAAYYASNHNALRPSCSSGWFLPSYRQWVNMQGVALSSGTGQVTGSSWLTTEYSEDATKAWFYSASTDMTYTAKNMSGCVRSCFAYPSIYASLTSAHVGQILTSDGCVYYDYASVPAGKTPVAMIAYIGVTGENSPYNHGLAIALTDANNGEKCNWKNSRGTNDHTYQKADNDAEFASESGLQYNNSHNTSDFPAFQTAISNNEVSAPTGCSSWFLPSGYQWSLMMGSNGMGSDEKLRLAFSDMGGTNIKAERYWSCTENSANYACYYVFGEYRWSRYYKDSSWCFVRAVVAF